MCPFYSCSQPFGLDAPQWQLIQLILVRLVDMEHMYLVVIHVKKEASDPMRAFVLAFHRMQFFVPLLEES